MFCHVARLPEAVFKALFKQYVLLFFCERGNVENVDVICWFATEGGLSACCQVSFGGFKYLDADIAESFCHFF